MSRQVFAKGYLPRGTLGKSAEGSPWHVIDTQTVNLGPKR